MPELAPGVQAALGSLLVWFLGAGGLGWWTARKAHRLGVSGHELEARRDADAAERTARAQLHTALDYIYDLRGDLAALGEDPRDWPAELTAR